MKALDWIFKLGLLIIGIAFVAVYFLSSQNGRYQYLAPRNILVDTKTGIQHQVIADDTVSHFDLVNGKLTVNKIKKEDIFDRISKERPSAEEFLTSKEVTGK